MKDTQREKKEKEYSATVGFVDALILDKTLCGMVFACLFVLATTE